MRKLSIINSQGLDDDDVWYYISNEFNAIGGLIFYDLVNDIWHVRGWIMFSGFAIQINNLIPLKSFKIARFKTKRFFQ